MPLLVRQCVEEYDPTCSVEMLTDLSIVARLALNFKGTAYSTLR